MGKYDDFDLDLKKVMSNNTASEAESVVSILQTLATECFTFDGYNVGYRVKGIEDAIKKLFDMLSFIKPDAKFYKLLMLD